MASSGFYSLGGSRHDLERHIGSLNAIVDAKNNRIMELEASSTGRSSARGSRGSPLEPCNQDLLREIERLDADCKALASYVVGLEKKISLAEARHAEEVTEVRADCARSLAIKSESEERYRREAASLWAMVAGMADLPLPPRTYQPGVKFGANGVFVGSRGETYVAGHHLKGRSPADSRAGVVFPPDVLDRSLLGETMMGLVTTVVDSNGAVGELAAWNTDAQLVRYNRLCVGLGVDFPVDSLAIKRARSYLSSKNATVVYRWTGDRHPGAPEPPPVCGGGAMAGGD